MNVIQLIEKTNDNYTFKQLKIIVLHTTVDFIKNICLFFTAINFIVNNFIFFVVIKKQVPQEAALSI